MLTNNKKGYICEKIAVLFLRLKGYRILKQRYKTPFGEIDIIAKRGKLLVAVEVKYRVTKQAALESIQTRQQKRINKAFLFFTQTLKWQPSVYRLDVICMMPWHLPLHLQNAWLADSN